MCYQCLKNLRRNLSVKKRKAYKNAQESCRKQEVKVKHKRVHRSEEKSNNMSKWLKEEETEENDDAYVFSGADCVLCCFYGC